MMKLQIFNHKEVPQIGSNHTCLAIIVLYSVFMKDGNYYPQAFLRDCKYIEKEIKVIRHITEDIESFSSDSNEEQFFL